MTLCRSQPEPDSPKQTTGFREQDWFCPDSCRKVKGVFS
jgi:hypothetical protein